MRDRLLPFLLLVTSSAICSAQVELVSDSYHAYIEPLNMTVLLNPVSPSAPRILSLTSPTDAPAHIQLLRYHAGGAGTSVIVEVEKCMLIDTLSSTLLGEADCAYRTSGDRVMEQPKWTWHADSVVIDPNDGSELINLDANSRNSENFDWRFHSESFSSGTLRVRYERTNVGAYRINCSLLTDDASEDENAERSRVWAADLPAYPNPLVIAECGIGAHSRQVLIFDPLRESKTPILRRTGSFKASVQPWQDRLRIEYDRPCSDCESGFELRAESWPARDEATLPPISMAPSELVSLIYHDEMGGLPLGDDPEFGSRLLSRELRRILRELEPNPYLGELDFDPTVDGQDALLTELSIGKAKIEGRMATVQVNFKNFDTPITLTYLLVLETEGWRLDNIVSPHWDMRALLTAGQ